MIRRAVAAALLGAAMLAAAQPLHAADADDAGIKDLLSAVEKTGIGGADTFLDLLTDSADRTRAQEFYDTEIQREATKVVVLERERAAVPDTTDTYRLLVDALIEYGARGRVATWLLDVRKTPAGWRVESEGHVTGIENVYRLSVNKQREYTVRNLTVSAEDLQLTLVDGTLFTVDTDEGTTGLVFVGRGEMRFDPAPPVEKGQVKIFAGSETLESRFDAVYMRLGNVGAHLDRSQLVERPVDGRDLRRAEEIFREESPKSYVLDLADLTRDNWSLPLPSDDFVAEVRTRRFETLTYARSGNEPEDISLFDRRRQRNIAVYPSRSKLEKRGPFYSEDDTVEYDVVNYDLDVTYSPDRQWFNGIATLRLKVRSNPTSQITIRLAEAFEVKSIVSNRFGRLFGVRARGLNAVLVSLPDVLPPDADMSLTVTYYGHVAPDAIDRETISLAQESQDDPLAQITQDPAIPRPEPSFLYSSRSYWYPQAPTSDYATATIHLTVPATYECIASGIPADRSPVLIAANESLPAVKLYTFIASRPVRYLSFLVTHLMPVDAKTVAFDDRREATIDLSVQSNPKRVSDGRDLMGPMADVEQFYESIIGDLPYQALQLVVVDGLAPGGHSPAYFAIVAEPMPGMPNMWRNDPAMFRNFPEFFLAHEAAHQWWGQAVGWSNYHEQWLSEGFAQYFAAMYAQHRRGDETFRSVMRQMRKWSMDESDQGPVYLGYRLGNIRKDGRVFRALVYNKGAIVLHMLRRLVGDDAFFRGVRRFYAQSRFAKVSTEDLRRAMEEEAGRPLDRFFERWIYGSSLPRLTFSSRIDATGTSPELVAHVEQVGDELFDVPVTLTLQYANRRTATVVMPVTDRSTEMRIPLDGVLRSVDVSKDDGMLADVQIVKPPL